MAKINVPPTRSNLIRMKQELKFAQEGYEILDRKRDVLAKELVRVAHDAEKLQEEMDKLSAAGLPRPGEGPVDHGTRTRGMGCAGGR